MGLEPARDRRPGPRHVRRVLDQLGRLGWFKPSTFKDVCIGQVDDVARFLEAVRSAGANAEGWANLVARVIPLQRIFIFTPESFADQLKEAVALFVEAMRSGSFYMRERPNAPSPLEGRGTTKSAVTVH